MKKLILICLLILSGCQRDVFQELGYSFDESNSIRKLAEENQVFFSEKCNDFLKALIDDEDFKEENIKGYLIYEEVFEPDKIIELVNNNTISNKNYGNVKRIVETTDFKFENLNKYLKSISDFEYDASITVKACNDNLLSKKDIINKLQEDLMFVENNLDLYLKHYDKKDNIRDLVEYVNSKRYLQYYEDQQDADIEKYGYQVLVNKYYCLKEDYEPDDLVPVEAKYGVGELRKEAYNAYKQMQDDANKEGYSFYITSPYRSFDTQSKLYNRYLQNDIQSNVDIYSARPGSSEHQLGLAVDILKNGYDFGNFYSSPEAKWLAENAYKYGFILRYPSSKIDITGYKYEPWHFRYVGDIAKDVYDSGVTYDEYFEKYIK